MPKTLLRIDDYQKSNRKCASLTSSGAIYENAPKYPVTPYGFKGFFSLFQRK